MYDIIPIPAFNDNYIWAIVHPQNNQVVIVDPGDAKPVMAFLQENNLNLHAILITHHHHDHTGGLDELCQKHACQAYGPNSMASLCDVVHDGDSVKLFGDSLKLSVMSTPGHTLDHIVYHGNGWLFCGDTLFSAGCGRIFEGTPEQMWQSLQKLQALPDDTAIYCAHEYTLNNLQFAQTLDPSNKTIARSLKLIKPNQCSLPSTIAHEKKINPYFRCHLKDLQATSLFNDSFQLFKHIRSLKDGWQAPS